MRREPVELPVYDLTVAGAHEFFANGILVHNCLDAARMAVLGHAQHRIETILADREPSPVFDAFIEM